MPLNETLTRLVSAVKQFILDSGPCEGNPDMVFISVQERYLQHVVKMVRERGCFVSDLQVLDEDEDQDEKDYCFYASTYRVYSPEALRKVSGLHNATGGTHVYAHEYVSKSPELSKSGRDCWSYVFQCVRHEGRQQFVLWRCESNFSGWRVSGFTPIDGLGKPLPHLLFDLDDPEIIEKVRAFIEQSR